MSGPKPADALFEMEALEAVEKLCRSQDIHEWEIFMDVERSLIIEAKDQKVESLVRAEHSGIALRIFKGKASGKSMGFSYATDLRPSSLKAMVERAAAGALETGPDRFLNLAPPESKNPPELDIFDKRVREIAEREKIALALSLENSALSFDRRIRRARDAEYEELWEDVFLRNSLGLDLHAQATIFSLRLMSVAEDGDDAQSGFEFDFSYNYDKLNAKETGAKASAKAVGLLGARPASTGRYSVVLTPESGARLMGVLSGAFSAEAVDKGRSWLKDKLGKKMFAESISITDSGLCLEGAEAFPFDGEGTCSRQTRLVDAGVVSGLIYDRYHGAKMGSSSTGNCVREGIEVPPSVGPRNFYIEPGNGTTEDLIGKVSSGLLVEDLLGVHTADPITGEFSFGCSGRWIENGRCTNPVMGMALAGRLGDLFGKVEDISGDLRFWGGHGSPGLLIGGVDLSGI